MFILLLLHKTLSLWNWLWPEATDIVITGSFLSVARSLGLQQNICAKSTFSGLLSAVVISYLKLNSVSTKTQLLLAICLVTFNPLGPRPATAPSLRNPLQREVTVPNDPGIQL